MPDEQEQAPSLTPARLARVLRQYLGSLEAAGVEWLPAARLPLPLRAADAPAPGPAEDPDSPDSPAARQRELEALARRVAACTRCPELAATRTQTVFGVGPLDPELCLVGEAPGADEDAQGEPFVGAAGQLLNRILAACGLRRED